MENLKDKDLYDDLRIQLIIDSNCNLACEYCVLLYKNQVYKEERSISYQVLDKYITFFIDNYDLLLKYYRKITLTFFWWEPLLSNDKIIYIMDKLFHLGKINFVIHTNWILLNKKIINEYKKFDITRFSYIISIDWQLDLMMKYRLKNKLHHFMILRWIKLLRENNIRFLFSPSIMKPTSNELLNDYIYLYNKKPDGIIINPVTAIYRVREKESDKEIAKGVKLFLDYLRYNKKLSDRDIIEFMWLPLNINDYKDYLKFWFNLTGDIDWTIHAMSFAWQWFDDWTTYWREDLENITLWNVIFNKELLLKQLCRKDLYSDEKIWEITYNQQRRWTLPDWDVQNMLANIILRYFRKFYLTWRKSRYGSSL